MLRASVLAFAASPALAQSPEAAAQAFADTCFSPYLTAPMARDAFAGTGARVDFYDLRPFSNVAPSPAQTEVAEGTDRRCEIAFDGDHAALAAEAAVAGLAAEGITQEAPVPDTHTPREGTELLAARYLNPNRIAVVHVGTRPGPNGTETFMNVERLEPLAD